MDFYNHYMAATQAWATSVPFYVGEAVSLALYIKFAALRPEYNSFTKQVNWNYFFYYLAMVSSLGTIGVFLNW